MNFIISPYTRTRETYNGIRRAFTDRHLKVREDVRIREREYGNFDKGDMGRLHLEKKSFGEFYYRFPEGESPADCYDRASAFLETLYRSWEDNQDQNLVIVGHGLMILGIIMRLFRRPPEDFNRMESLRNCEFVVLERPPEDAKFRIAYTWGLDEDKNYAGLRTRQRVSEVEEIPVWNGDPNAPLMVSSRFRMSTKTGSGFLHKVQDPDGQSPRDTTFVAKTAESPICT